MIYIKLMQIWFFYASQIKARLVKGKANAFNLRKVNYVNKEQKEQLLKELEKHQDE